MDLNSILIPTDFSTGSAVAFEYALVIAKKTRAHIHLLHMEPTPLDWKKIPLEKEYLYPEIKANVNRAKNELYELEKRAKNYGIVSHINLIFDQSSEEITQHVNCGRYDLVVMGSHGATGLRKYIIGSNALRVIRYSKIPVLIVKKQPLNLDIKNIVFYSKFENIYRQPFKKLTDFVTKLEATLHLLYINTPYHFLETQDIQDRLGSFCKEGILTECAKHVYDSLNDERGIDIFMKKEQMDILSLATTETTGWGKLFTSSLTEDLVNHLDIPVLSFRV